ncbi:hypothetical protein NDU88_001399 [Pleurodeles waltl]|uniref:Uncharacterized protein n=1 Tax=Pleurodeles waltl TaxID=8319 RepID=A0AAV7RB03_PLEWA|nr:hypothetical protein NDU88_001399 [Pleurodeles waltl]
MAGCDAPRFLGRLSEAAVHQDAGRHAGGQSLQFKARPLLVHRKEERVNSEAVYPTTREAGVRCSLGHSAGSILEDEQPSTSWGAGASFDMQEETLLDYEEDEEEQNARVAVPVLQSMVPEVVQGDRSGTRRKITAGYLPRGCVGGPDGACTVWIVGHSFIRWAEKQAATRHFGRQLGLDGVRVKAAIPDQVETEIGVFHRSLLQGPNKSPQHVKAVVTYVMHTGSNQYKIGQCCKNLAVAMCVTAKL